LAELHPGNSERAKAWHERADDGSFDTTLVWNRHVRIDHRHRRAGRRNPRTTATILGYIYRVVHPAGARQRWKAVPSTRNGSCAMPARTSFAMSTRTAAQDSYAYDAHGNLVEPHAADAAPCIYAYDQMDNVTGILRCRRARLEAGLSKGQALWKKLIR
jgi:YD repeat-containing protein